MLGNTLSVTIGGNAYTLTKINQDSYASEYLFKDSDEQVTARIRHTKSSKGGVSYDRHNIELRHLIYSTPTAAEIPRMTYLVIEQPSTDIDTSLPIALCAALQATSNALIVSLSKWES